jgi:hypothetical protein
MSVIKAKCSEHRNLEQTLRSACIAGVGTSEGMTQFEITDVNMWTGFVWLRIQFNGRLW